LGQQKETLKNPTKCQFDEFGWNRSYTKSRPNSEKSPYQNEDEDDSKTTRTKKEKKRPLERHQKELKHDCSFILKTGRDKTQDKHNARQDKTRQDKTRR
jgi:hypothetical protein